MSALSSPNGSALTFGFVTSDTHFTNDLGADLLDHVELMLEIEDQFASVEITGDDVEADTSRRRSHAALNAKLRR